MDRWRMECLRLEQFEVGSQIKRYLWRYLEFIYVLPTLRPLINEHISFFFKFFFHSACYFETKSNPFVVFHLINQKLCQSCSQAYPFIRDLEVRKNYRKNYVCDSCLCYFTFYITGSWVKVGAIHTH